MPEGSLSVSKALMNVSLHFKNEEFIWPKVFGEVPVKNESGHYWIYTKNFRLEDSYRADKAPAEMASWDVSTGTYYIERHGLKDSVSQRDRDNSDLPSSSLDQDTTEFLTDKLMMRMEYEGQKLLFTTTTFSSNATLTTATSFNYNTTLTGTIRTAPLPLPDPPQISPPEDN